MNKCSVVEVWNQKQIFSKYCWIRQIENKMTLSKLFVILSLMTFLSLSVVSLETGYNYDPIQDITIADKHKDLKCGYLFSALTHMRLMKLMLESQYTMTEKPFNLINNFDSRAMICSIQTISEDEIGSLWIFHLYKSRVNLFYSKWIQDKEEEVQVLWIDKLLVTHNYVIDTLKEDSKNCRKGNMFDSYEKWYALAVNFFPKGIPDLYLIQQETIRNVDMIHNLLKKNIANPTNEPGSIHPWYDGLKIKSLFMNNLGFDNGVKTTLMNLYSVDVTWYDTNTTLMRVWKYAHKIHLHSSQITGIQKYYLTHFNFLKTIMFRLLWKHLLYIKDYTGNRRVSHLKKMCRLLVDFKEILCLQDDSHIAYLLDAINNLAQEKESIVNIIYDLISIMYSITHLLSCNATDPMTVDCEDFSSNMNPKTYRKLSIVCNSHMNEINYFLSHLRVTFQSVNFDVIRSLIKYLNKIKNVNL